MLPLPVPRTEMMMRPLVEMMEGAQKQTPVSVSEVGGVTDIMIPYL